MSDDTGYFSELFRRFGSGWNRFWFTPSHPLPLAVMRIGVGLLATYLVATYGFDLRRFFDLDVGLIRLDTIRALQQNADVTFRFSYLDYVSGNSLTMVHYAGVAVLALFTLGVLTRLTAVGALVVFLSYLHRGPMLTGISEPIVTFMLFYLCLGPCGACLSVDAWLKRRRSASGALVVEPTFAATVPLRLMQVHISLVYFLMFCGKMQAASIWWNGTAVWWLIARPESSLVDLRFLNQYPYVVNAWTTAIFLFEPAFALLIWNRLARPLLLCAAAVLWLGTALVTGLVPFCLAIFIASLSFVSAAVWQRLLAPLGVGDCTGFAGPRTTSAAA